jgi:hypothetical protein
MPPIWKARKATNRRLPTRPESAPIGHLRGREWLTKARPHACRLASAPIATWWLADEDPQAAEPTGRLVQRQQAATVEVPDMTLVPV